MTSQIDPLVDNWGRSWFTSSQELPNTAPATMHSDIPSCLETAPLFDASRLPRISRPYIPADYSEVRILADTQEQLTMDDLAIAESLKTIRPEDLGPHATAQGTFGPTRFFAIRTVTATVEQHVIESVAVIFQSRSALFVIDGQNLVPESYHPDSPIAFRHMRLFFQTLLNCQEVNRVRFQSDSQGVVTATFTKERVRLYTLPTQHEANSFYDSDTFTVRMPPLFARATAVALLLFATLQYREVNVAGSFTVALATLAAGIVLQELMAEALLCHETATLFRNETIPSHHLMTHLASSRPAIKQLTDKKWQLRTNLDKTGADGKTLLNLTHDPVIIRLLIKAGSAPTMPEQGLFPLLQAAKEGDDALLRRYIKVCRDFERPIVLTDRQTSRLFLESEYQPLDTLIAELNLTPDSTVMRELFNRLQKTDDCCQLQTTINRIAFLIKRYRGQTLLRESFALMREMNRLSTLTLVEAREKMKEKHGAELPRMWQCAHRLKAIWRPLIEVADPLTKPLAGPGASQYLLLSSS